MKKPLRRPSQLVLGLLLGLVLLLSQQAAMLHLLGHAMADVVAGAGASAAAGAAHENDGTGQGDAGHPCAQCLVAAALSHGLATAVWTLLALTLERCAFIALERASATPRFELRYWVNGPPARH